MFHGASHMLNRDLLLDDHLQRRLVPDLDIVQLDVQTLGRFPVEINHLVMRDAKQPSAKRGAAEFKGVDGSKSFEENLFRYVFSIRLNADSYDYVAKYLIEKVVVVRWPPKFGQVAKRESRS